jgi:hypothetical protein
MISSERATALRAPKRPEPTRRHVLLARVLCSGQPTKSPTTDTERRLSPESIRPSLERSPPKLKFISAKLAPRSPAGYRKSVTRVSRANAVPVYGIVTRRSNGVSSRETIGWAIGGAGDACRSGPVVRDLIPKLSGRVAPHIGYLYLHFNRKQIGTRPPEFAIGADEPHKFSVPTLSPGHRAAFRHRHKPKSGQPVTRCGRTV